MRGVEAVLGLFLLAACQETEECKRLAVLVREYEQALEVTSTRAGLLERTEKRAQAAEAEAKARLSELGLDLAEAEITSKLEARVGVAEGAKLERGVRPVAEAPGSAAETETIWTFEFEAKDGLRAEAILKALLAMPPLTRFGAVIRQPKGPGWKLLVARASAEEIPIKPDPTPTPERRDPAQIPTELGFCGAGGLRDRLRELDSQIAVLTPAAEKTTVLLPAAASWQGLKLRADRVFATEEESRRIALLFLEAVRKSGAKLKGVGAQGDVLVLELFGDKRAKAALERALDPSIAPAIQEAQTAEPGTIRLMIANRVASERRRP